MELIVGLLTGFLGSLFGLGGGFILVPFLTFIGYDIHRAVGTSSASIVFTALSATFAYHRQGRVRYGIGALLASSSVVGAYIGALLTSYIPARELEVIFGIVMIYVAIRMIFKKENEGKEGYSKILILIGGFAAGVLSGLLGVGGGIVNVPLLVHAGLTIHEAVATSSFTIIFTATSGAVKHALLGNTDFNALVFLGPGLILGAQLGALVAKRTKSGRLRLLFSAVVIVLALKMIL